MAKVTALFSSSKANCCFISSAYGNILVDFGASFKATNQALKDMDFDIKNIDAVLITHEHTDHIKGLKTFTNQLNIPIISREKTLNQLEKCNMLGAKANLIPLNDELALGDLLIKRFPVSHDCVDPSGYRIDFADGTSAAYCTDLGFVSEEVKSALMGSNAVLIESNHDLKMLEHGPYPPELKLRIAGEKGHLNNNSCDAELKHLLENGTTRFILGHLSEKNNTPVLALSSAEAALLDFGAKKDIDYILKVASPAGKETVYF